MLKRILILLPLFSIAALSFYAVWTYKKRETPNHAVSLAIQAIAEAERSKSHIYAKSKFQEAKQYHDSAMYYWRQENTKWFYNRRFDRSISCANKSVSLAKSASEEAKAASKDIKSLTSIKIRELEGLVARFQGMYKTIPLGKTKFDRWIKGKLMLEEGIAASKSGNFILASKKLKEADHHLSDVFDYTEKMVKSYFENFPQWQTWTEDFVTKNKKQRTVGIIVDKYQRRCYVYKSGKLIFESEIELSPFWIGDKRFQGDRATPEGHYKVVKKKALSDTKYYKALLLNYPNEEDKARFSENLANNNIPQKSKIGGLIEIHGHGGKGLDWTDGCVALTNDVMDRVYDLASVGTEVLIVGALMPLEELTKSK